MLKELCVHSEGLDKFTQVSWRATQHPRNYLRVSLGQVPCWVHVALSLECIRRNAPITFDPRNGTTAVHSRHGRMGAGCLLGHASETPCKPSCPWNAIRPLPFSTHIHPLKPSFNSICRWKNFLTFWKK